MFVYTTTIWTPYHESICRELGNRLGDSFRLVLTEPIDSTRNLGWELDPPREPWIVRPPLTRDDIDMGLWAEMILQPEVAVIGAVYGHRSLFRAVDARVSSGKKTFFMAERPFKKGLHLTDFLRPYNWYVWWRLHRRYDHRNVHILAIGNGVREDLRFLRVKRATISPWGYFPAISRVPTRKVASNYLRICWCGRMVPCKHVEVLITAVSLLPVETRARCRVVIAGDGEMRDEWMSLSRKLKMGNIISFLPMLPHDEALGLMADSDVYAFPSDGEEGWGVALEEAMDKCCVPIACQDAGAASRLIEDGASGYLVPNGDAETFAKVIDRLIADHALIHKIGRAAWERVQKNSPSIGVVQLLSSCKML